MLKITSVAVGLLTLLSLSPAAQAFPISIGGGNSQPQIKVILNPQTQIADRWDDNYRYRQPERRDNNYRYRQEQERYRLIEARNREARNRWESAHRRQESNNDRYKHDDRRYDRDLH